MPRPRSTAATAPASGNRVWRDWARESDGSGGRATARCRGTGPRDRRPRPVRRPSRLARATRPRSPVPPSRWKGEAPAPAAMRGLGARRRLPLTRLRQCLLALLAPRIELVRLEPRFPGLLPLFLIACEPVRAPQLVVGLDQIRPELERLLEERLGILVHLALQIHEAQIEVGVERSLLVVAEPDGLGEMLDRLAKDPFLEADVADVDAGEGVRRLLHQDFLEGRQGVVVLLVEHLRPSEQRLRLRLAGRQLERLLERLDGSRVITERNETPALLDERGGADVIGVDDGARARELRRRRFRRGGGDLLEAVHELAHVLLQGGQLADQRVHALEVGDDFALHRLALRAPRHGLEATRDLVIFAPEGGQRRIDHQVAGAVSFAAVSSASFSLEVSRRAVLSTMIVRPSFTTRPVMYSAARPFTIPGGDVISGAATCSTSVTASTTTPSFPPSHSRITVRVSSRSGAAAPSRLRRSTSGTATPW